MTLGLILQFMILTFNKIINNNPNGVSFTSSLIYLILSRPLYVIGFSLFIMPLILGNKTLKPFT